MDESLYEQHRLRQDKAAFGEVRVTVQPLFVRMRQMNDVIFVVPPASWERMVMRRGRRSWVTVGEDKVHMTVAQAGKYMMTPRLLRNRRHHRRKRWQRPEDGQHHTEQLARKLSHRLPRE